MPRFFTTNLYLAHKQGMAPADLAEVLGLPIQWVEEHLEAARLCMEKQVRLIRLD